MSSTGHKCKIYADEDNMTIEYSNEVHRLINHGLSEEKLAEFRDAEVKDVGDESESGSTGTIIEGSRSERSTTIHVKSQDGTATYVLPLVEITTMPVNPVEYIIIDDALGPRAVPHPDAYMDLKYVNTIISIENGTTSCIYPLHYFYNCTYKFELKAPQADADQLVYPGYITASYTGGGTGTIITITTKQIPNIYTVLTRRVPDNAVGLIRVAGNELRISLALDDQDTATIESEEEFINEGWLCGANIADQVYRNGESFVAVSDGHVYNVGRRSVQSTFGLLVSDLVI